MYSCATLELELLKTNDMLLLHINLDKDPAAVTSIQRNSLLTGRKTLALLQTFAFIGHAQCCSPISVPTSTSIEFQ